MADNPVKPQETAVPSRKEALAWARAGEPAPDLLATPPRPHAERARAFWGSLFGEGDRGPSWFRSPAEVAAVDRLAALLDAVAEEAEARGRAEERELRAVVRQAVSDLETLTTKHCYDLPAWPQRVRSVRDRLRSATRTDGTSKGGE